MDRKTEGFWLEGTPVEALADEFSHNLLFNIQKEHSKDNHNLPLDNDHTQLI